MTNTPNKNPAPAAPPAAASPANRIQIIKYAPPPPQLPMLGKIEPAQVSFIGQTNYVAALEEKKFVFGIKRDDRRRHVYVIGKSGVGKSKLLELLIRQDIASGAGLCLMDPHGDIIEDILNFIPESRIGDVCLVDPSDAAFPPAFNPLASGDVDFRHQLAEGLIEVMKKQFGTNWNPRLEHIVRFTALALLDYPQATMYGMVLMLTDHGYRQRVVGHVKDEMVKRFWAVEFTEWSQKFDADAIAPLVNKLGQFFSDPVLRAMFSQLENKIDIEQIMQKKKILLINLSRGKLGAENASFLGALFLAKIKQAGTRRARIAERDRGDFYLYVDEFQDLATPTFESLLSEARKYGISLTVANRYLEQLPSHVQAAIMGNIGSIIVFRVGGQDAEKLEAEMAPVFKVKDMINLGRQEFYIKLMIDGDSYDPFSARTLKVLKPDHQSYRERIVEASRRAYGIPASVAQKPPTTSSDAVDLAAVSDTIKS